MAATIIATFILAFLLTICVLSHTSNPSREEVERSRMEYKRSRRALVQELETLRQERDEAIRDREHYKGATNYWKARCKGLRATQGIIQ